MSGLACALLACAVLCWPGPPAAGRLRRPPVARGRSWVDAAVPGPSSVVRLPSVDRLPSVRLPRGVLGVAALLCGVLLGGPGGAVAAALLGATGARVRRAARRRRDRTAAAGGLADALASFAAELRSGAPAAAAAESAAADAHPVAVRALTRVAATARLGGDVPAALRALGDEHLDRLAGAWALAERHGVALAGPLGAVATDLRARARLAGRLDAQLAGPRATAVVLACLPVLGVLLGEGIGARPWSVLTSGGLGQVLLVIGVGLVCVGVLWTARITARVAR